MVRNKEKDIILICKGWFDQEKYPTIIDALRAYQCEYCGIKNERDIPFRDILLFALYPVAEVYFKQHHWMWMFRDGVERDISLNRYQQVCTNQTKEDIHLSYEYLCNIFIRQITQLQVIKDGGEVVIDFSEYPSPYEQII